MWAESGDWGKSVLWLQGLVGAGKSAIVQTVAKICIHIHQSEILSLYDNFGAHADVSSYLWSELSRIHKLRRYKYVMQYV